MPAASLLLLVRPTPLQPVRSYLGCACGGSKITHAWWVNHTNSHPTWTELCIVRHNTSLTHTAAVATSTQSWLAWWSFRGGEGSFPSHTGKVCDKVEVNFWPPTSLGTCMRAETPERYTSSGLKRSKCDCKEDAVCRKHSHRQHHSNTGNVEKDQVGLTTLFGMGICTNFLDLHRRCILKALFVPSVGGNSLHPHSTTHPCP